MNRGILAETRLATLRNTRLCDRGKKNLATTLFKAIGENKLKQQTLGQNVPLRARDKLIIIYERTREAEGTSQNV